MQLQGSPCTTSEIADALARARAEFREMPGLQLTGPQASRLWGLQPEVSAAVLRALVAERFLVTSRNGAFVRAE